MLKKEGLILRRRGASTRALFESFLMGQGESLNHFHVTMEIDNIAAIKDLVAMNYGVTIIAYSACRAEVENGKLVVVPIENAHMSRDIDMVFAPDFRHIEVLKELREIYQRISAE